MFVIHQAKRKLTQIYKGYSKKCKELKHYLSDAEKMALKKALEEQQ